MNLPSASPNENMKTASTINPMPARRAERWAGGIEIFARRFMCDYLREARKPSRLSGNRKSFSRHSAMRPLAQARNDGSYCRHNTSAVPVRQQLSPRRTSAMTEFDPAQHRMVPEQRWFEDFVLGERFVIPSRTMTTAVFAAFQVASGDTHPVHYDVEYCRARGMPNLLAHGFQTLIHTAPGSGLFPYMVEESLVGFLEQSSRFVKPVFADDTIYPAVEVTELTPGRNTGVVALRSTVFNQRRELVLEGLQKFLIRRRPAKP